MSTETTDLPISLRCPRVLRNAAEEKAMAELGIKLPELVRNLLIEYVNGPMLSPQPVRADMPTRTSR